MFSWSFLSGSGLYNVHSFKSLPQLREFAGVRKQATKNQRTNIFTLFNNTWKGHTLKWIKIMV